MSDSLVDYMKKLRAVKEIPRENETALVEKAQNGDEDAIARSLRETFALSCPSRRNTAEWESSSQTSYRKAISAL